MKPSPLPIVLFIAAAVLLYCAFGTGWFTRNDIDIGLIRAERCDGGRCETRTIFSQGSLRAEDLLAIAIFAATFVTTMLAVTAGILLRRPGKTVVTLLAVITAGIAMVLVLAFVVQIKRHDIGFGPGFYLFWLAAVSVVGAGITGMLRPS